MEKATTWRGNKAHVNGGKSSAEELREQTQVEVDFLNTMGKEPIKVRATLCRVAGRIEADWWQNHKDLESRVKGLLAFFTTY